MPWVWILLGVIYILSPYDLIPDFIPVRGWIDDLIVLILMIRYIKRLRRHPSQHAREHYDEQQDTSDNFGQTSASPKTPHEVLGVPPNAGQEEIRSAYLNLAGRYHPDKVAHLGQEFQEMAEKRFKEIQNAYERLVKSSRR